MASPASSPQISAEPASSTDRTHFIGMSIGLILLSFAVYAPSLNGEFLWDDPAHVTRADLQSVEGLGRIWFEFGATQEYYPVLHSAFWLQYQLWGDATMPYHVVNILFHALNACLFAWLLLRLPLSTGPPREQKQLAWLAAVLFAVHPVAVESVAWITELKNTLSTFFYLLAALAYWNWRSRPTALKYGIAWGVFLLALAAKTMTVTLPAALLVVIWWREGSLGWKRDWRPLLPWFATALAAGLLTNWFESSWVGAEVVVEEFTVGQHVMLAARIFWESLSHLAWPQGLTFFYERWDVAADASSWWPYLVVGLIVTGGLWAVRKKNRGPLAAWLLYAGTLFPVLGLFKVYSFAFAYVADHYQYLAIPIFCAAIAAALGCLTRWIPRKGAGVIAGAAVLTLAALSFHHAGNYRNDETLFRANITANPSSWMGHHILAFTVNRKGPEFREEAKALYQRAIEINPRNVDSHQKLGLMIALERGGQNTAIAHYREALRIRPNFPEAHNGLAIELMFDESTRDEAVAHFTQAVELRPMFFIAHTNLGQTLAMMPGRERDAETALATAIQLQPNYAPAHYHLGKLLGRNPAYHRRAAEHLQKAIYLRPNAAEIHAALGEILARSPVTRAQAEFHFRHAIKLRSDQPYYQDLLNRLLNDSR